jgi:hypothetical protein
LRGKYYITFNGEILATITNFEIAEDLDEQTAAFDTFYETQIKLIDGC